MPSFPIYVLQDGQDFYVYRDESCEDLLMTRTCPWPVDMNKPATWTRARKWFETLCSVRQKIVWPNPFGKDS